ncbi:hypothetical protein ACWD25_57625, partial [Streptomyces sp. NPDC002920]
RRRRLSRRRGGAHEELALGVPNEAGGLAHRVGQFDGLSEQVPAALGAGTTGALHGHRETGRAA